MAPRNPTRNVRIGTLAIGGDRPVVVQSMCATKTQDVEATAAQAEALRQAGAGVVRLAVDSTKDAVGPRMLLNSISSHAQVFRRGVLEASSADSARSSGPTAMLQGRANTAMGPNPAFPRAVPSGGDRHCPA